MMCPHPQPRAWRIGVLVWILLSISLFTTLARAQKNSGSATWNISAEAKLKSQLSRAAAALDKRESAKLVEALEQARLTASAMAPLQLGPLHILAGQPRGQGDFLPAPDGAVQGDTLLLYARVRGFGTSQKVGDPDLKVIDIRTDASFFYEDGQLIATKKDIGVHHLEVREVPLETFMVLELKIKGLPAQPYLVELKASDLNSGKSAKARTRFVVR